MKIKKFFMNKYSYDIIICLIWSIVLIPLVLLNISSSIRIFLGLPFLLFIPGYLFLNIVFPIFSKSNSNINSIQRFSFSIVLSIVIVSFIGIIINFSPYKLTTELVLANLFILIFIEGIIAAQLNKYDEKKPHYSLSIYRKLTKAPKNKFEWMLLSIVIILIVMTIALFSYAVVFQKPHEEFTEFYILNENNQISDYPRYINLNDEINLTFGILNHEYQPMQYTIEFWLVDQSGNSNEETTINHMWFLKKESVTLNHFTDDNTYQWNSQWENTYSFLFDQRGVYRLIALLETGESKDYNTITDYKAIYESKIENAYREIHIFLEII